MPEVLIAEAAAEDEHAIRDLVAQVVRADVTEDPELLRDTIANVNGNVDLWLGAPARCVHLKATMSGRIIGPAPQRGDARDSLLSPPRLRSAGEHEATAARLPADAAFAVSTVWRE